MFVRGTSSREMRGEPRFGNYSRRLKSKILKGDDTIPGPKVDDVLSKDIQSEKQTTDSRPNDEGTERVPTEIEIQQDNAFKVGEKIEARYRGKGRRYYRGTIVGALDGTYNIDYDDGDKDYNLSAEFIRRSSTLIKSPAVEPSKETTCIAVKKENEVVETDQSIEDKNSSFNEGDKVEARYRGKGRRYYKGTILQCLDDGTYDIQYDDGDKDYKLSAEFIRRPSTQIKSPVVGKASKESDSVSKGQTKPDESIRSRRGLRGISVETTETPQPASSDKDKEVSEDNFFEFKQGQQVQCRYKGRGRRWYKGKIIDCLGDGTYDIQYDDGDMDVKLSAEFIRALDLPSGGNTVNLSSRASRNSSSDISNPQYEQTDESCPKEVAIEDSRIKNLTRPGSGSMKAREVHNSSVGESEPKHICSNNSMAVADGDVSFVAPIIDEPKPSSVVEELSQIEDAISEDMSEDLADETVNEHDSKTCRETAYEEGNENTSQHQSADYSGKGNRLYSGVVSRVKVVHLYEIEYSDGTKDVNIPFEALSMQQGATASDVDVGTKVNVLSWQDRFWSSQK